MNSLGTNFGKFIKDNSRRKELLLDVGSSYTRIYLSDQEIFNQPTCLAYHRVTDSVVCIGMKALKLLGKTPNSVEVVFPVQDGEIANTRFFELFLSTAISESISESKISRMIFGLGGKIAVMSSLSPAKRKLTKKILQKVGFSKIKMVDSSKSVVFSLMKKDKTKIDNICILDIGAQKTEIAVYSMGELIRARSFKWGGILLTEALQRIARIQHKCVVGWHMAEEAKIQVGALDKSKNKFAIRGKDIMTQASKTVVLSSEDLRIEYNSLFDSLLDDVQNFISKLPSETAISVLDRGIYLTGGSSSLKGLNESVLERLKCDVFLSLNPSHDVINGLAIIE